MICKWLPELVECEKWASFPEYEKLIYGIFKANFIDSQPSLEGKTVNIRREHRIDGYEQFFHITNKAFDAGKERSPDRKRCERIKWIQQLMRNC